MGKHWLGQNSSLIFLSHISSAVRNIKGKNARALQPACAEVSSWSKGHLWCHSAWPPLSQGERGRGSGSGWGGAAVPSSPGRLPSQLPLPGSLDLMEEDSRSGLVLTLWSWEPTMSELFHDKIYFAFSILLLSGACTGVFQKFHYHKVLNAKDRRIQMY